jgi:hypothetical protein
MQSRDKDQLREEIPLEKLFDNEVGRARDTRLEKKDWKHLKLIHDMLERSVGDPTFLTKGTAGERNVLNWVKSQMTKYSNVTDSLVSMKGGAGREKLYKVSFYSPNTKRTECFYVIFDNQQEYPPDVIPPGVFMPEGQMQ